MGVWYDIYNRHVHNLQLFFLCLLLISGQAAGPELSMSGYKEDVRILRKLDKKVPEYRTVDCQKGQGLDAEDLGIFLTTTAAKRNVCNIVVNGRR
jgi:hypothetical protein